MASQQAIGVPRAEALQAAEAFAALRDERGDAEPTDVVRRVTGRDSIDFESYVAAAAARGCGAADAAGRGSPAKPLAQADDAARLY